MSAPSTPLKVYDHPHQFEPLLPQAELNELVLRTRGVAEMSFQLQGAVHPSTRDRLREVVRSMNSYYSNHLEGESAHPQDIGRALKNDFSDKPDIARRQRIALAHIGADKELELLAESEDVHTLSSAFLLRAHAGLYGRLNLEDRRTPEGKVIEPGLLRQEDVTVGRHQPPAWQSLPGFLQRADAVYSRTWSSDSVLYAIAAAHHRMLWIHPFLDGNGRACRLQTHGALLPLSAGLWSINRGLAHHRDRYYVTLANADMARHGDLDGRGNLSERMLRAWCHFFIELCDDQVTFMAKMLDLASLKQRIAELILVRSDSAEQPGYRQEAVMPLHHVLTEGPVSRGEFVQMTGLEENNGLKVLSQLLKDGLLVSDGQNGDVGIGFPLDALNLIFPNLYPEAATLRMED